MNATAITVTTPTDGTQIAVTPAATPTSGKRDLAAHEAEETTLGARRLGVGDPERRREVRELEPSCVHLCFAHRVHPRVRAVGVP